MQSFVLLPRHTIPNFFWQQLQCTSRRYSHETGVQGPPLHEPEAWAEQQPSYIYAARHEHASINLMSSISPVERDFYNAVLDMGWVGSFTGLYPFLRLTSESPQQLLLELCGYFCL